MSACLKVFTAVVVWSFSQLAFSAAEPLAAYKDAENNVKQYRALRRACSITQGEQRRACFAQLNESTEDYKKAKKILSMHDPQHGGPTLGRSE